MSYFFSKKDTRGVNANTLWLNTCKRTKGSSDVKMPVEINVKQQKSETVRQKFIRQIKWNSQINTNMTPVIIMQRKQR